MLDPQFMHAILRDAGEIYLALNAPNTVDAPYVLPVNHVFHKGCIYFHCATERRKLDLLRANPRIGFSTAVDKYPTVDQVAVEVRPKRLPFFRRILLKE